MPDTAARPIFNTYNQLTEAVRAGIVDKQHALALSYEPASRSAIHGWTIWSPVVWFHPDKERAAWYEKPGLASPRGKFYLHGEAGFANRSKEGTAVALAEAQKLTGISEWKRNREGDFVPVQVQQRIPIPRRPS